MSSDLRGGKPRDLRIAGRYVRVGANTNKLLVSRRGIEGLLVSLFTLVRSLYRPKRPRSKLSFLLEVSLLSSWSVKPLIDNLSWGSS